MALSSHSVALGTIRALAQAITVLSIRSFGTGLKKFSAIQNQIKLPFTKTAIPPVPPVLSPSWKLITRGVTYLLIETHLSHYSFNISNLCTDQHIRPDRFAFQTPMRFRGGNSTTAEDISRFQHLFPNRQLVGIKMGTQPSKTSFKFTQIDNGLMVTS